MSKAVGHMIKAFKIQTLNASEILARVLHCCLPGLTLVGLVSGCLLTPPIEPQEPEMNYPPFIDPDFVRPEREVIRVEREVGRVGVPPIRVSVETFLDPNAENVLYYAWIGKRLGLIEQAQVGPNLEQTSLYKGIFYQFGRVEIEIDPCIDRLRGVDSETLWVFVADRRFVRVAGDGVQVEAGGYLDSHAWVFEFDAGLCSN
ncbi:MAG: hypothetical protein H0U74_14315 [Bradymonadaceae bacterium]|nr:hypothetical protein [Lujinxingiaceae bacterium]